MVDKTDIKIIDVYIVIHLYSLLSQLPVDFINETTVYLVIKINLLSRMCSIHVLITVAHKMHSFIFAISTITLCLQSYLHDGDY